MKQQRRMPRAGTAHIRAILEPSAHTPEFRVTWQCELIARLTKGAGGYVRET